MKRIVAVVVLISLVGLVVYLAIFQPQVLKSFWLWIVGFAGLIWSGLRGLFDFLTPNSRSLNEIEADNKVLKSRLEEIKAELQEAKQRLAHERAENQREIERITLRIEKQKAEYDKSRLELEKLRSMGYRDYINTLPPEEKIKMEEEIWNEVDFGL